MTTLFTLASTLCDSITQLNIDLLELKNISPLIIRGIPSQIPEFSV